MIFILIATVVACSLQIGMPSHIVYTTEAFYVPISRKLFEPMVQDANVEYQAALMDMPDLPDWMYYRHPNGSRHPFLYGTPKEPGIYDIEVIALNKYTYESSRKVIKFQVEKRAKEARYEVEMKFSNMNVEDIFQGDRLKNLQEIFSDPLWQNSETVYVTLVASAVDMGGRVPLNPREKEGVVVRIGGMDGFSNDLLYLEREVQPIRNRYPCPRDYKRTSAEHVFRRKNFISDWCSFRLLMGSRNSEYGAGQPDPSYSPISLASDDFQPQPSSLPRRNFLMDFVLSIIAPSVVVIVLMTAFTCVMFGHREGLEKRIHETPSGHYHHVEGSSIPGSEQLVQYNSIQRASNQLRQMDGKRDPLPRSASSPASSLPRSRASSPTSMVPKASTPRAASRTGTLTRGSVAPPPPYTPPGCVGRRAPYPLPLQ